MKHLSVCLIIASSLSSCTMTEDPSEGGFFGWSQSMANVRIEHRGQYNEGIKANTRRQSARVNYLKTQMQSDLPSGSKNAKPNTAIDLQDVPDPDALSKNRKL